MSLCLSLSLSLSLSISLSLLYCHSLSRLIWSDAHAKKISEAIGGKISRAHLDSLLADNHKDPYAFVAACLADIGFYRLSYAKTKSPTVHIKGKPGVQACTYVSLSLFAFTLTL
jgi:hypothetical protein